MKITIEIRDTTEGHILVHIDEDRLLLHPDERAVDLFFEALLRQSDRSFSLPHVSEWQDRIEKTVSKGLTHVRGAILPGAVTALPLHPAAGFRGEHHFQQDNALRKFSLDGDEIDPATLRALTTGRPRGFIDQAPASYFPEQDYGHSPEHMKAMREAGALLLGLLTARLDSGEGFRVDEFWPGRALLAAHVLTSTEMAFAHARIGRVEEAIFAVGRMTDHLQDAAALVRTRGWEDQNHPAGTAPGPRFRAAAERFAADEPEIFSFGRKAANPLATAPTAIVKQAMRTCMMDETQDPDDRQIEDGATAHDRIAANRLIREIRTMLPLPA